ncbi:uncharacterized protein [Cicer arietinum]|uniref:Zinc transporter zipt-7.2-like isoform X1 n=1 Tax=Cicer arietinum TaxID=3827 RepID=A0A1S2XN32_CICAR|nr:zinc transporter zipt-7.2-like isoform X1 [Cicer arietinum]
MEQKEVSKIPTKSSVPQFGGWDQKAPGATDYSMVFTQARENKKHQKTDLTQVKRNSIGNEQDLAKASHGHAHPAHGHVRSANGHVRSANGHANPAHGHAHPAHGHAHAQVHAHAQEDPVVMGKKRILTYINCCIRP